MASRRAACSGLSASRTNASLQDVLSKCAIADAPLEVSKEGAVVVDENGERGRGFDEILGRAHGKHP
jgi:hypothetical protein